MRAFFSVLSILFASFLFFTGSSAAADGKLNSDTFKAFEFRNIGPAFMSGRIADIAIHPDDPSVWYLAVGSGGVWKTTNAGTTWAPLFDGQSSYSIGAITLDPQNPNTVWVGTGENVGGRHVGFGDGVYRSLDGGMTWQNMGLKDSQHISRIIVHPTDSNTVWVASQGPLWSPGGERGLYMTTDGGETWENVLSAGEWTGVTDVVIDPRDPNTLYAATWQHHRTVAGYMGGGPETALHKSTDGGKSWRKLSSGLPTGNLGKIGLAISPQDPDVVYAAIELNRRSGGVWRSADRGESWEKRSDTVSGATGPHYYQELIASPHEFDRIYLVDVRIWVSEDGGTTFARLPEENKHSDNHAIAFHPDDPNYIMVGSDGGLYETFDNAATWRYVTNLPLTQFYKIAVDDALPFYNIVGGTQDNNTQMGPSRTDNVHGIRNMDWFITLFGDGHQPATEPGNPNIIYSQWQQGNLTRMDRETGELVYVKPQAAPGQDPQRYNWDAPVLVSAHDPKRIYHAAQRVWRSDDRGDSWTMISGDLTRNEDRMNMEYMGRVWEWDAPHDLFAMSNYNTITSLAESPLDENVLYAGTDDGLVQITSDGGQTWTQIEVGDMPGVPDTAFVNDIKADLYDVDTVYIALDNHKYGDFKPYLLKSTNRGRTWKSIASDLPENHLVWRLVQDHKAPNLLFLATEFGVFFTVDGGKQWIELTGGIPTISFRDIAIQRREDDLVLGSFGRGIFILDDYAPLRAMSEAALAEEALLFGGRDAWWYIPRPIYDFSPGGDRGHANYMAPNPPLGAVFTYYLKDALMTMQGRRNAQEAPLIKDQASVPFPGFDALDAEMAETAPQVWLIVRDAEGNVVRRISAPVTAGFHRVAWDFRTAAPDAIGTGGSLLGGEPVGHLVAPGTYTVALSKQEGGVTTELVGPQEFVVKRMREGTLPTSDMGAIVGFWEDVDAFQGVVSAADAVVGQLSDRIDALKVAFDRMSNADDALFARWQSARDEVTALNVALNGSPARAAIGQQGSDTVTSRLGVVQIIVGFSTYGPTQTAREQLGYARDEFAGLRTRINALLVEILPQLEADFATAGAPLVVGAPIPVEN